MIVVLRGLHFQGHKFSCYAFHIKFAGSGYLRQICLDSHGLTVEFVFVFFMHSSLLDAFECIRPARGERFGGFIVCS